MSAQLSPVGFELSEKAIFSCVLLAFIGLMLHSCAHKSSDCVLRMTHQLGINYKIILLYSRLCVLEFHVGKLYNIVLDAPV